MKRVVLLCLVAGCAHTTAPHATSSAQEPGAALPPERVVQAEVTAPPSIAPGARGELRVLLRIASGYHVMSDRPSNPLYIPTRVRFDDVDGISFGATSYPVPQSFELGDERISTFEGARTVTAPFTVAQDAAVGPRELTGTLEYQSCTRTSCLFPVKRALRAQLVISR